MQGFVFTGVTTVFIKLPKPIHLHQGEMQMGRKPKPVPAAREMDDLKALWRKVLPRIEEVLDCPPPSPLAEAPPATGTPAPN